MPGYFDSEAGKAIQSLLETKGLRFYLNSTIANMRQDETGGACSVFLADGKEMSCDLVVVATGCKPIPTSLETAA